MKFRYKAKNPTKSEVSRRVPGAGLEPARYCYQRILSPSCLPIPPPRQ